MSETVVASQKDAAFWNRVARAGRQIDADVIELDSYLDNRGRVLTCAITLMLFIVVPLSPVFFGRSSYPFEVDIAYFHELFFYDSFLRANFGKIWPDIEDFDEFAAMFAQSRAEGYGHVGSTLAMQYVIIFGPMIAALVWVRRAPLRIDRARGLAYTMRKGELWYAQLNGGVKPLGLDARDPPHGLIPAGMQGDGTWGYTQVHLHDTTGERRFMGVGAYPPTHGKHPFDVIQAIEGFRRGEDVDFTRTASLWGDFARRFRNFSLRRKPDLDSAAVQTALDALA